MFKNFKNPLRGSSEDAGVYASQTRDDFSADDVEHYFNYMGMLATEGTYDRLNDMLNQGLAPVDLLLLMAAQENDAPRVAELIRAGADLNTKGQDGKTAMELASDPQVHELLREPAKATTF
ncbi:g12558 [Coccomyxa viridis]|uniref:G12558 protein n=1 Tax=Coccomyxa viridis TaxID=1274662 RepID=A0ABP1GBN8_9CHLO